MFSDFIIHEIEANIWLECYKVPKTENKNDPLKEVTIFDKAFYLRFYEISK